MFECTQLSVKRDFLLPVVPLRLAEDKSCEGTFLYNFNSVKMTIIMLWMVAALFVLSSCLLKLSQLFGSVALACFHVKQPLCWQACSSSWWWDTFSSQSLQLLRLSSVHWFRKLSGNWTFLKLVIVATVLLSADLVKTPLHRVSFFTQILGLVCAVLPRPVHWMNYLTKKEMQMFDHEKKFQWNLQHIQEEDSGVIARSTTMKDTSSPLRTKPLT